MAVVGLEVVFVGAEAGELVDAGLVGDGPAVAVVDFEVVGASAAGADAARVACFEGASLGGGDGAAVVHDGADVLAFLDDELDDGVAEQGSGGGEADGSDAGDLAGLPGCSVAPFQRDAVDEDDQVPVDLRIEPCRSGDHLARYLDAYTAGQLTRACRPAPRRFGRGYVRRP